MDLPLVGFVSVTDLIFSAILLICLIVGLVRGFKAGARGLLVYLISAVLSIHPTLHRKAAEFLLDYFPRYAPALAYLVSFFVPLILLGYLFALVPPMLTNMKVAPSLDRSLGAVAGLVKGALLCTMGMIVLAGWRLPWDALYQKSQIATALAKIWFKLDLLPFIYSFMVFPLI